MHGFRDFRFSDCATAPLVPSTVYVCGELTYDNKRHHYLHQQNSPRAASLLLYFRRVEREGAVECDEAAPRGGAREGRDLRIARSEWAGRSVGARR
eukprot:2859625-Prymnesium_polylepis.1